MDKNYFPLTDIFVLAAFLSIQVEAPQDKH